MKIQFTVTNQHIEAKTTGKIVADSRNYLEAVFFFVSPEWENMAKTVVFSTKFGTYNVILENGTCMVPPECIIAGEMEVSVFGGDRVTTDVAKVKVHPSGYRKGETPPAPTPDVYAQILEKLQSIQVGEVSPEDIASAVTSYMEENPVKTLTEEQVREIVNDVISSQNQPQNPDEEQDVETQSEEVGIYELINAAVSEFLTENSEMFRGPEGSPGEKGDTGRNGKDAALRLVYEVVSEAEPGNVYAFGSAGSSVTCTFAEPEDKLVENIYAVRFVAVSNDEAPLFKREGSEEYITPRILSPIVTGEKYKAVYEWDEGILRIM